MNEETMQNTFFIVRLTPPGRGAVASILLVDNSPSKHPFSENNTAENSEFDNKLSDTLASENSVSDTSTSKNSILSILKRYWNGTHLEQTKKTHLESSVFLPKFGRLQLSHLPKIEEEVVLFVRSTNEVEIHCHGGEAVISAIEKLFSNEGGQVISWTDHFCSGNSQKEIARKMLAEAQTERVAQILIDQYNGALEMEQKRINTLQNSAEKTSAQNQLQKNARLARHLITPFQVVIAGSVNVGKSSLLNSIAGFQRTIVHSMPGTTRDVVSFITALNGFPFQFLDTAGFRETENIIEQQGISRTEKTLQEADLILWIFDATKPAWKRPNLQIGQTPQLICWNKIDQLDSDQLDAIRANHIIETDFNFSLSFVPESMTEPLFVSALQNQGIDELLVKIFSTLVPDPPKPFEAVPLTNLYLNQ
ncbi:MAG: GTPase [Thermoguttaceae bacterium]